MICNTAIQYFKQLSIADYRIEVGDTVSLKASRFAVHELRATIDNELVGVKDKFKQLVYKQLGRELAMHFAVKLEEKVVPKRQKDEPVEEWLRKPVMLDVTNDNSLLQFIFTADLDSDDDSPYAWKNVSVEIRTVTKPQNRVQNENS